MERPPWRLSPVDGQLHLIGKHIGELDEALCQFTMLAAEWQDPGTAEGPRCTACIMALGAKLSAARGDIDWFSM